MATATNDPNAQRKRLHGLRAQAADLRRTARGEAHDAADSLDREADDLTREMYGDAVRVVIAQASNMCSAQVRIKLQRHARP